MPSRHELTGVYQGLKHPSCCWDNADGTQAIIGRVTLVDGFHDGIDAVIKGSIYPGQLVRGLTYRFFGFEKSHDKYGDQFVFESFVVETPAGEEAVVAYLTQCKGVGPGTARSIFKLYADDSVRMLREEPEAVAASVPRFTIEKAIAASEFLKKSESTERSKMDLLGLLKGRGFPKKVIDKVIDHYGAEAATIVHRNPYLLMRYKGCGFLKTDKMYLDLRHNPNRMKRQALCAWHSIARDSSGDTWFPFAVVRDHLRQNVSSAAVDVERAMELAVRAGMLSECYRSGQRFIAERIRDKQEGRIADLIEEARKELVDNVSALFWLHVADQIQGITEHQRSEARLATAGFIGILAGRPGTGKTYTCARIVKLLCEQFDESHIAIAAPTGKAAVRVTSAMQAVGIDLVATTLHSLLGFSSEGFRFNRGNPLRFKFIIVDESSMIDTAMMANLLDARSEGAHILFIGDCNQLAPVGHGAPLRDLIIADVPCGELIEIQRNSGRIVRACGEIIDRGRFQTSEKIDLENGENLILVERDSAETQIDTLAAMMLGLPKKYESIDPIWDVQVIVAVNARSELGRKPLNLKLQELLNPDGRRVMNNPFRVGDKIINTKNSQYKTVEGTRTVIASEINIAPAFHEILGFDKIEEIATDEPTQVYVANGEQAEVLDVDSSKIIARLTSPDRTILIPRTAKKQSEDGDTPEPQSEGGEDSNSEESSGSGCSWELAYAISGHKSQGSEWPIVIVMVDDAGGAKRVQSKQWIYTSISRAKKICYLVGQQKTANDCCRRDALFQRRTFLSDRIRELHCEADRIANQLPLTEEILDQLFAGV